jgi:hypothetical protein
MRAWREDVKIVNMYKTTLSKLALGTSRMRIK